MMGQSEGEEDPIAKKIQQAIDLIDSGSPEKAKEVLMECMGEQSEEEAVEEAPEESPMRDRLSKMYDQGKLLGSTKK